MNKLSWRTVSEFIAAFSIVVSMIFVGLEIRGNSAVARATLVSTFAIEGAPMQLARDPIIAPILARVTSGEPMENFDAVESFRIAAFYTGMLNVQNAYFVASNEGVIQDGDQSAISNSGAYSNIYFRALWESYFKDMYSREFIDYFESLSWNNETL